MPLNKETKQIKIFTMLGNYFTEEKNEDINPNNDYFNLFVLDMTLNCV